jgi:hypothetical protein
MMIFCLTLNIIISGRDFLSIYFDYLESGDKVGEYYRILENRDEEDMALVLTISAASLLEVLFTGDSESPFNLAT